MVRHAFGDQRPVFSNSQAIWLVVLGPQYILHLIDSAWHVSSRKVTVSTTASIPRAGYYLVGWRIYTFNLERVICLPVSPNLPC